MSRRYQAEFLLLAAIWGASFLFMRIAAPDFGPMPLMLVRCAIGAAVLVPLAWLRLGGSALIRESRGDGLKLLLAGVLNSAIPFVMFGYAALSLNAGFSSILNATAPIFGAIVGYFWLKDRLTRWRVAGLMIGIVGVALLSWDKASFRNGGSGWAVVACLVATFCYGIAGNFAKRHMNRIHPLIAAAGSQVGAALVLLPPGIVYWPAVSPSLPAWLFAMLLGAVCTGVAYILYFRLIANVNASAALSVTFLIPVFGVVWGAIFLAESIDSSMVIGGAVIVLGTALATGILRPGGGPRRQAKCR